MLKYGRPANDDMVRGYRDGFDPDNPEPGPNQSAIYRHGFANGRDDLCRRPRATAEQLRREVDLAMAEDERR